MHETHDGVQVTTFIRQCISSTLFCFFLGHGLRHVYQNCPKVPQTLVVQVQAGQVTPFIEEILSTVSTIICDLQPQKIHTFYEAVGYMISAQSDKFVQEPLIERYMLLPNQVWDDIINQATRNVDVLKDPDAVKQLANILKV